MDSARRVPLIAAVPKMFLPFLVILPGLIAVSVMSRMPSQVLAPASAESRATLGTTAPLPNEPLDETHPHGMIPVKVDPLNGQSLRDPDGTPVYNDDLAIPIMLLHYFPTGILGLGLTALLASFMSGMAENVTPFNAVWTYDIYQSYLNKRATDEHYLWMDRLATVGGVLLSIGAAYLVTSFNNIMDSLQLIFSVVNAPLFATFLPGMFWKRSTGHGAFAALVSGTVGALVHQGVTLPVDATPGIHGGWIDVLHRYPSEMAQYFWTAIFASVFNLAVTFVVSLMTRPRPEQQLVGLVYSLTPNQLSLTYVVRTTGDSGRRCVESACGAESDPSPEERLWVSI